MNKRELKKLYKFIYAILIVLALFLLEKFNLINSDNTSTKLIEPKLGEKIVVTLNKCIDGDTAKFNLNDDEIKVRFLAIDTPETVHPYKDKQEYGKDASEYTCSKLESAKKIELQYEETYYNKDKYNRYLAWIFVDDNLLQKELINNGYAKVKYVYAKYKYTEELKSEEEVAKENKVGVWSNVEEITYRNKIHTVTFKYNNKEDKIKVIDGSTVDIIDNPYKEGYIFTGWKYGNNLFDLETPITKNITLKASFKKIN